jgi:hypothetical protein
MLKENRKMNVDLNTLKDLNEFVNIVENLSSKIRAEKKNSLRLECTRNIATYTTHFKVNGTVSRWIKELSQGKLEVPRAALYDVKTTGFSPFPEEIKNNVTYTENKCIIDLRPALKFELFSIETSFRMNNDFLNRLVHTRSSPEPLKDKVKYDLSAQLKNPEGLELAFSRVDVEEFPLIARVHVADRINTNVPDYVKELVKIESELISDRNPHSWVKEKALKQRKVQLMRKLGKGDLLDKIEDLTALLSPSHFRNYVESVDDFKLFDCERGSEFFRALGMCQLPKFMNVISMTDLSLEKPAAKGKMYYNCKEFDEEILSLFS